MMEMEKDKKAMTSGFKEQIKGAKGRIEAITEAIDKNDWEPLLTCYHFDETELDELQNGLLGRVV